MKTKTKNGVLKQQTKMEQTTVIVTWYVFSLGMLYFSTLKKLKILESLTLNWNANQKPPPITSQLCCWIQLSSKIVMPFNKKVWCNCNTFYACTYSHVRDDTHITSMKTVQFSTLPTRCPTTSEMCLFMAQA